MHGQPGERSTLSFVPIGTIRTPFQDIAGMPIQPTGSRGTKGTITIAEEYREGLKSSVADIKNVTSTRWGGAITAGLFLKEFVKTESWAHVDLSGNWSSSERDFRPHGATGEGPRWLLDWILG